MWGTKEKSVLAKFKNKLITPYEEVDLSFVKLDKDKCGLSEGDIELLQKEWYPVHCSISNLRQYLELSDRLDKGKLLKRLMKIEKLVEAFLD